MNRNKNTYNKKGVKRRPKTNKVDSKVKAVNESVTEEGKIEKLNNDPSWYFKDAILAKEVSSFSFNQFLGASKIFTQNYYGNFKIPYCMRLLFNPCPGWTDGTYGDAGINIAAMKAYTKLSSMNAKTTQYAPQDISTLMLALGEVISMSELGRRALGLAFTYNKRNWSFPREIIRAAGFDPDYLLDDLAQHRMEFNVVVNMINQIAFPADLSYFQKCGYMYSHVFVDSESPMAQTYVYVPRSTWIVDDSSYDQGTILKTLEMIPETGALQWSEYITHLTNMIQAILNSATFQYIYADVLRLFDGRQLLTVPFVDEGYIVMPEYDPMALLQINNATIVGVPAGNEYQEGRVTPKNDVYPSVNKNALVYTPQWQQRGTFFLNWDRILNFPHSMGNPDEYQRIESTRFTTILNSEGTGDDYWVSGGALPDHYVTGFTIFGGSVPIGLNEGWIIDGTFTAGVLAYALDAVTKFNHAPLMYVLSADGNTCMAAVGDFDFFTTIDYDYLRKVDDLAFTNLLSVFD